MDSVLNGFKTSGREIQRMAAEFQRRRADAGEAFELQWVMADRTAKAVVWHTSEHRRRPWFELKIRGCFPAREPMISRVPRCSVSLMVYPEHIVLDLFFGER